jgi:DNA-binding CsgD family transcriptional regulator
MMKLETLSQECKNKSRCKLRTIASVGGIQLPKAGHFGASSGVRKEVTSRHPRNGSLSSELPSSVKTLVRELILQADNGWEDGDGEDNDIKKRRIIVDAEVDGVRCLLTRLEKSPTSYISFSPRESEIARMVAKGYPNKTIAAVLEISPWTVCTHLRRIFAKLHVSSRAAMVARLINDGIVKDVS